MHVVRIVTANSRVGLNEFQGTGLLNAIDQAGRLMHPGRRVPIHKAAASCIWRAPLQADRVSRRRCISRASRARRMHSVQAGLAPTPPLSMPSLSGSTQIQSLSPNTIDWLKKQQLHRDNPFSAASSCTPRPPIYTHASFVDGQGSRPRDMHTRACGIHRRCRESKVRRRT